MKEENVLKHPKKPVKNKIHIQSLIKLNDNKIPKKKDAIKLIIDVF